MPGPTASPRSATGVSTLTSAPSAPVVVTGGPGAPPREAHQAAHQEAHQEAHQGAKAAMRRRIRAERAQRSAGQREQDAAALAGVLLELPEIALAQCVAIYASVGGEPGTGPAREALRRRGVRILLPIVLPDLTLDWAQDDGDLVVVPGIGGPEPAGPRLGPGGLADADVVVAPALAVDTLGNRLGQGGGCYDRALLSVGPWVPVVALVHASEVLDAAVEPVPAGPHDLPVDAVVTPQRCLRLPRRRG